MQRLEDDCKLLEFRVQNDPEKIKLLDQIARLEAEAAPKANLKTENEALFSKIQSLNGQIELLCIENSNLKEG